MGPFRAWAWPDIGALWCYIGDVILTEALPYRGAVSICRGANFKRKGLPMDELGVLPEALEAELTEKPKTSEDILIAPSWNCHPPGSRTHAGCNEEATRGAPKDHPPMDEAFKGQATVHRRDFRLRQDRGAAERERIRSQSPQSV
jgi:hypothetical protein